jgi:hypothetical protein
MARREISGKKIGEVDELVPDPDVAREFNISLMTLSRWALDPDLGFPDKIQVRKRNFRSREQLNEFKQRLLRTAIAQRGTAA